MKNNVNVMKRGKNSKSGKYIGRVYAIYTYIHGVLISRSIKLSLTKPIACKFEIKVLIAYVISYSGDDISVVKLA